MSLASLPGCLPGYEAGKFHGMEMHGSQATGNCGIDVSAGAISTSTPKQAFVLGREDSMPVIKPEIAAEYWTS